ncbi:MAG: photosynthetic complex putative assembly protein PuhB [Burkholderiaceae bacterium]
MKAHHHGHEHELEPEYGLPERLPEQERIVWQGSPSATALFQRVFHARGLVVYFSLLMALRVALAYQPEQGLAAALREASWMIPVAGLALMVFGLIAWLMARTTVYTITTRRVVMRIGIVLNVTFNLPFKRIASADLRLGASGVGDIALTLVPEDKIAFLHLWPHAKPWTVANPVPMMRCLPAAEQVGRLLHQACAQWAGRPLASTPASNSRDVEQHRDYSGHREVVNG